MVSSLYHLTVISKSVSYIMFWIELVFRDIFWKLEFKYAMHSVYNPIVAMIENDLYGALNTIFALAQRKLHEIPMNAIWSESKRWNELICRGRKL